MADEIPIKVPSLNYPVGRVPINQVPDSASRLAENFTKQVDELGSLFLQQEYRKQDREAINAFYTRYHEINQGISTVKDIDMRDELFRTGITDAVASIREQYPYMSSDTVSQLEGLVAAKLDTQQVRSLKRKERQAKRDYIAFKESSIRNIIMADNEQDRQIIKNNAFQHILDLYNTGFISKVEAGNLAENFQLETNKAYVNNIILTKPGLLLGVGHGSELGLSDEDLRQAQRLALSRLEMNNEMLLLNSKTITAQEKNNVWMGKYKDNPMKLVELRDKGIIDQNDYDYGMSNIPSNQNVKDNLMDILDNGLWKNSEEVDEFYNNWVRWNNTISGSDRTALLGRIENIKTQMNDSISKNKIQLIEDAKNIRYDLGRRYTPLGKLAPENVKADAAFSAFMAEVKDAKDIEKQNKAMDNFGFKLNEIFHINKTKEDRLIIEPIPGHGVSKNITDNLNGLAEDLGIQ